MSRDWTPREMYEVERYNIRRGIGSLWDFMRDTNFTVQGETFPMVSEEAIANRKRFPLLGRLFEEYDKLYSFLSQVNGGMELLERHEKELDAYIKTEQGDRESPLIKWFEGKLDPHFYYRETNDALLLASVQDEVGTLYRFDPSKGNCFWFPLNRDMCISVWLCPDDVQGDQLRMKLEQRAEEGSMGPHCEVLIYTESLSYNAICDTLQEIYRCMGHVRELEEDAPKDLAPGLAELVPEGSVRQLADQIMAAFGLKKRDLESQIRNARAGAAKQPDTGVRGKETERDEGRG